MYNSTYTNENDSTFFKKGTFQNLTLNYGNGERMVRVYYVYNSFIF